MKKQYIYLICLIFMALSSCKKDEYIRNTETMVDTVSMLSWDNYREYWLTDNSHLFLDATSPGAISYQWLPTHETSPIIEAVANDYRPGYNSHHLLGTYDVIVTFLDTVITYRKWIFLDESVVYCTTSFTPNGDGKNNNWQIMYNYKAVKPVSLAIYDQHNIKVYKKEYKSENSEFVEWDGKRDGRLCDAGFYYFIFHYTMLKAEKNREKEFCN